MVAERNQTALDRVLELTVLLGDDMTRGLAALGLTGPRAQLLFELAGRGPSTQRALAEALRTTPRNVTGLVDGLVAGGFVVRQPHPHDRRATQVTFTDQGAQVAEGLVSGRVQLAEELFGAMPAPVLDGLVAGLDAVLERLKQLIEEQAR